ncbi:hypothetical protein NHQ30_003405 [Ciborinia camelliae]|nr:hypothetical protein NHQ30_003405 [Ciborinia camelliae]
MEILGKPKQISMEYAMNGFQSAISNPDDNVIDWESRDGPTMSFNPSILRKNRAEMGMGMGWATIYHHAGDTIFFLEVVARY